MMTTTTAPTVRPQAALGADLAVFGLLVWGMAIVCTLAIVGVVDFAALDQSPAWVWAILILTSWLPALAGLGTQVIRTGSTRGFVSGWRLPKLRWVLIGLAIPCVYAAAITLLTWLSGAGTLDLAAFIETAIGALGSGWAAPEITALCYAALTLIVGTLALSIFALGEEMGWSGYVIPRLLPQLGIARTALLTGLLWSSYHFPLILLAKNYTQGTTVWFTLLGLTVGLIGVAFVSTWLRARSGSIWPAVLLHASHNMWLFYIYEPLTRAKPQTPYVGGEHGLGMMLVAVVLALLVFRATRTEASKRAA